MADDLLTGRVDRLRADFWSLRSDYQGWTRDHNRSHNNTDERLNLLLKELRDHGHNHHGRVSQIKQGGWVALMVTAAALAAELVGLLDLLRGFSFPF